DQSAPLREAKVKENAHSIVFLRGGDVSDRQEDLGEYVLQFGKIVSDCMNVTEYFFFLAPPPAFGQPVSGVSTASVPPPASSPSLPDHPPAPSQRPAAPPLPSYEQDVRQWICSHQQRIWMKTEMEALGLWPGSRPVRHLMNMISLWRNPPQPELIDSIYELPAPKYFQLHPFFIWKPEHAIMERVRNNYSLPCLYNCNNPHVVSSGVGRPRVVIGTSGQYYILASRLCCRICRSSGLQISLSGSKCCQIGSATFSQLF
ncbi:hypothetical protein XENOCAPTIV_012227, partial [Xenoophorus captivus]